MEEDELVKFYHERLLERYRTAKTPERRRSIELILRADEATLGEVIALLERGNKEGA